MLPCAADLFCFTYMSVFACFSFYLRAVHVCLVLAEIRKEHWVPWKAVWLVVSRHVMLGSDSESYARAANVQKKKKRFIMF